MPSYFLAIPADYFEGAIRPALAASRRTGSFAPLQPLCGPLLAAADRLAIADAGRLLEAVRRGIPFDRRLWRALVEEVLLLAAEEVPEIRLAPRSLCRLLGVAGAGQGPREHFTAIEQAVWGSRELAFGPYPFRPLQVGLNECDDVARLAGYLAGVDASRWRADDLVGLPELDDDADRAEELAFVTEGLQSLRDFYCRSAVAARVMVCEPAAG